MNDGLGIFTDSGQVNLHNSRNKGLALGDVDGDGDVDMWVALQNIRIAVVETRGGLRIDLVDSQEVAPTT